VTDVSSVSDVSSSFHRSFPVPPLRTAQKGGGFKS